MKTRWLFGAILFAIELTPADVLVGDLENGTKRNSVGGDCYFFSM